MVDSCSGKVGLAIERYLDRIMEPQVLQEANLAQITKVLEMLLDKGAEFGVVYGGGGEGGEDPVSRGLRELAEEMEREVES